MNGLDELRSTLDRHAHDVVDHDLGGRLGLVHQRVRAVRRRRRAAAAGAAVLAVVVAVGVGRVTGSDPVVEPSPAKLAGLDVPGTIESLGYTYRYSSGEVGEGIAAVVLEPAPRPRLVSWGKAGADDRVTVTALDTNNAPLDYDVPDFSEFVSVPAGVEATVSARGEGEFALAVYELDLQAAPPPGLTVDGVTFREDVAGDRLLDAAVGSPGESEVTVSGPGSGTVSYRYFCADAPPGATLHLEVPGAGSVTGECDPVPDTDPGAGSGVTVEAPASGDVGARLWVTDGEEGPPLVSDDVVVALGVYAVTSERSPAAGYSVRELVEHDGRLWRRAEVRASDPGQREVVVPGREGRLPQLVVGFGRGDEVSARLEHDGTMWRSRFVNEDGVVVGPLWEGDRAAVRLLTEEVPAAARLAIALYERVDERPVD
ncbi:hypothetical protein [Nocardioides lijunqiniae]|uniref:hypothetical protein n=1 Tax=Nocardioides lijunqiniae TaxID=2760832 RepID=UPI00187889F8|nr:hypothetical protein [Nocardioides lijunqiniae]